MILGVDPGAKRIGIAGAEEETRFAVPLEVIDTTTTDPVARIVELVNARAASLVVVGRPTSLSGRAGPAVADAEDLVAALRAVLDVPVEEYDERLTTVIAERSLRSAGAKGSARASARDAVAAQVMLQGYLDARS